MNLSIWDYITLSHKQSDGINGTTRMIGGFSSQTATNGRIASMWWRPHDLLVWGTMCLTSSRRLWTNWSVVTDLERHRTGCTNTASSILRALMLNKLATLCEYLKCLHEVWYLCSSIVFWARITMLNSLGSGIDGYTLRHITTMTKRYL